MSYRILILAAIVALLGAMLVTGPALAGKPSATTTDTGTATLTASPNPAPAYGSFHGEGCSYVVGKTLNVVVHGGGGTLWIGVDSSGCMSFDWPTAAPGSYLIEAFQHLRDHGKNQWVLMASTTLLVQ
ncbi:MAG: hypothetical protein HYS09_03120 [Chloroflexi bacterium]|nr:hypothetical protein [Chloroflexota bacterium]